MATLFTKIATGEIPSYKVAEDDKFLAFLDINPMGRGHTLVIPKKEVDYIFNMDDATLAEMIIFAKRVAQAIEMVVPCKRVGVAVIGLEVPHAHIHLIPLNSEADIYFGKPRQKFTPQEYSELTAAIACLL